MALIRIAYHDADSGEASTVTLDPVIFVGLVHTTRTLGPQYARAMLQFGATLVTPELTVVDTKRLDYVLTALERYIDQWDDPADLVLALSYAQRRGHTLTDAQAALFATALLDQPVSADTWRQHMDQWAETHHLPPLDGEPQQHRLDDQHR